MAKRGKPSARRGAIEVGQEGDDGGAAAPAPASLESSLVLLTFIALITALVLSQLELSQSYGKGLF